MIVDNLNNPSHFPLKKMKTKVQYLSVSTSCLNANNQRSHRWSIESFVECTNQKEASFDMLNLRHHSNDMNKGGCLAIRIERPYMYVGGEMERKTGHR
eukprot:scaffold7017_cov134-Cylindrotheca_fusiformis.AAC.19